jgi:hypothetical protein
MYLTHNFSIFVFLFLSVLFYVDANLMDSSFINPILHFMSSGEYEYEFDRQAFALYVTLFPFSIIVALLSAIYFFTSKGQLLVKDIEECGVWKANIFKFLLSFIVGIAFSLIFLFGGGVIAFKMLGKMSHYQTWWLLILQTVVIIKTYGLVTSTLTAVLQSPMFYLQKEKWFKTRIY